MKPALPKLFYVIHFSLLLSLFSTVDNAQAENLTRSEVIGKDGCKADAAQSYALYLPTSYTTEKRWAVLYCFDPAARGVLPVKLFQTAAEKYGYIVVGSNNSRNGRGMPTTGSVRTLLQDTH